MGLFQGFGQQRQVDPTAQGLIGMGQQMMAAGAPTTDPNQSGLAAGAQGFMQGYSDAMQQNQAVRQQQANQEAVNEVFDPYTFEGMQDAGQPGLLGQLGNQVRSGMNWLGDQVNFGAQPQQPQASSMTPYSGPISPAQRMGSF